MTSFFPFAATSMTIAFAAAMTFHVSVVVTEPTFPPHDHAYLEAKEDAFMACCKANIPKLASKNWYHIGWCQYGNDITGFTYDANRGSKHAEIFDDLDDDESMRAFFHCYAQGLDVTPCCKQFPDITPNCYVWCNGSSTAEQTFTWAGCNSSRADFQALAYISICHKFA